MTSQAPTFQVPILLLIYNRPLVTERVLATLRKLSPAYLFIAADGPKDNEADIKSCEATRILLRNINWPCEVKTLMRERNLGCKLGVSTGISWFFENVEKGIILEDDCIADLSFFEFCSELLNYYKDDEQVMHISGINFQFGKVWGVGNYYFSRYPHVWGWATWRRAWKHYDVEMSDLPDFIEKDGLLPIFQKKSIRRYWYKLLSYVSKGSLDTWDHQWAYAIWKKRGLAITPNVNLVSNIGFGAEATHTKTQSNLANLPTYSSGNLAHPLSKSVCSKADFHTFQEVYKISLGKRLMNAVFKVLK